MIFNEIRKNNLIELKKFLQYGNINIVDNDKKSLLHHAVASGAHDCIIVLLDNFIDVNIKDKYNQTALFEAAIRARIGMLKILIRNKAEVNIQDIYGNTPLFYAIRTNNKAVIDLLCSISNKDFINIKKEDSLFIAIKYNCDNYQRFIQKDNLYNVNYKKDCLLHYACRSNNISFIKRYCTREAVNYKNNNNETVFFYAVKYSNREIVRYMIQFIPCTDILNKHSESLLDVSKSNPYKIDDIMEDYINSLDFIYYKRSNKLIYNYLCYKIIDDNISRVLIAKKDKFDLSLLDYVKYYKDYKNQKLLTK